MEINAVPKYDMSDNPTECCPRFKPEGWDEQELHFKEKRFVKAKTRNLFHIPLNMGSVMQSTFAAIENAKAMSEDDMIILSYDPSPWTSEHYFSASKEVPDREMARLTGDYLTKVFEGPYRNAPKWIQEVERLVKEKGRQPKKTYLFYTTCPKCAKHYGKNYVVAVCQYEVATSN